MAEKPHTDSLGLDGMTLRCSILYIYVNLSFIISCLLAMDKEEIGRLLSCFVPKGIGPRYIVMKGQMGLGKQA